MLDGDSLAEVITEMEALDHLSHPNVVKFYGGCTHKSHVYLVTEWLPFTLDGLLRPRDAAEKANDVLSLCTPQILM